MILKWLSMFMVCIMGCAIIQLFVTGAVATLVCFLWGIFVGFIYARFILI